MRLSFQYHCDNVHVASRENENQRQCVGCAPLAIAGYWKVTRNRTDPELEPWNKLPNQLHAALTVDSFQSRLDSLHVCLTGRWQVSCIAGAGNLCSRETRLLGESLQRRDDVLRKTRHGAIARVAVEMRINAHGAAFKPSCQYRCCVSRATNSTGLKANTHQGRTHHSATVFVEDLLCANPRRSNTVARDPHLLLLLLALLR